MVAAMAGGFSVTCAHDDAGGPVLTVRGELDIATAPLLLDAVDELAAGGAAARAVDLRHVTFIDSSGLSALLIAAARLPDGDRLALRAPSEAVMRVLTLTGMLATFDVQSAGGRLS